LAAIRHGATFGGAITVTDRQRGTAVACPYPLGGFCLSSSGNRAMLDCS
jgi:hypothetical protein